MASGSFYGSAINEQQPFIFWSYTQDITTRQTTLTLTLKVKRLDNNYLTYKNSAPYSIECPNGTVAKSGSLAYRIADVGVGAYLTIGSIVKTLQHGTNGVYGAGSVTAEGIVDLTGTSVGTLSTGVGTIPIATIPVASTVNNVTGLIIGGVQAITLASGSAAFNHTVEYAFGGYSGAIVSGLTGSLAPATNWDTGALAAAMLAASPNSATLAVTLTVKTYSGATLLGTSSQIIYLTAASSVVPTISGVSNEDSLQILGATLKTWYVQSKSKIKVLFQCAGVSGSTIVTRELKINGIVVANALNGAYYEGVMTSPIAFSSGNTYCVTVTDSRGRTATTGDIAVSQVAVYSIPKFTSCLVQRCLQNGTLDGNGTWLKITPDWDFSSVVAASVARNAIATKNWKIGTGATTPITTADGVAFIVSNGTPSGSDGKFSVNSSFLITVTVTDTLGGSAVVTIPVGSAKRLFSMNAARTGVAVGKAAEVGATNFEVDLESKFNKGIYVTNRLVPNRAGLNCNDISDEWHLGGFTGATNYPDGNYWYVNTILYADANQKKQIAYGYNFDKVYTRYCFQGTWQPWVKVHSETDAPTYAKLMGTAATFQALTQTAATFIKWNTSNAAGSMVASASAGTITCNFAGYIQVSANMMLYGCTVGDAVIVDLLIGGTIVYTFYLNVPIASYFTVSIPAMVFPVTSGQTVLLQVRNTTAARGNAGHNNAYPSFGCALNVLRV